MSYGSKNILGIWVAAFLPAVAAAQIVSETVSFKEGFSYTGTTTPYTGTFNVCISNNPNYDDPAFTNDPPPIVDGAIDVKLEIDGYGTDGTTGLQNSWDRVLVFRFDNIIGHETGKIPPNATILSASLNIRTGDSANDQSAGPFGVAKLLVPITNTSTWSGAGSPFGENGPDFRGGDFDRPVGGYEGCVRNSTQSTDVTPIVQSWVNGESPNHGFIVMIANSADAWSVCTSSHTQTGKRPQLAVTFTRTRSRYFVFQQGLNGYAGTSMLRMQASGTTELGTAIPSGAYVDGAATLTDALIKFDGIFGTGLNQVAPDTTILKAFLTLTTSPDAGFTPGGSVNSESRGRWDVHQLLVDVDWAGDGGQPFLWTEFLSADGPTELDGEIGPTMVSAEGLIYDSRPPLDVTNAVQAWQSGAEPNYGLLINPGTSDKPDGTGTVPTTNGWKINWLGDLSLAPQLVLVVPSARADLSGDGYVDQTDIDLFEPCAATSGPAVPYTGGCSIADLDDDRDIDQADYGILQACFSGDQLAASECR